MATSLRVGRSEQPAAEHSSCSIGGDATRRKLKKSRPPASEARRVTPVYELPAESPRARPVACSPTGSSPTTTRSRRACWRTGCGTTTSAPASSTRPATSATWAAADASRVARLARRRAGTTRLATQGAAQLIVTSQAYRQSVPRAKTAAAIDADARLLWRIPAAPARRPKKCATRCCRIAGKLDTARAAPASGSTSTCKTTSPPTCRSTHRPRDLSPRRLSSERPGLAGRSAHRLRLPDYAFSAPARVPTTTPLQALTLLNHRFTLDMADCLARARRMRATRPNRLVGKSQSALPSSWRSADARAAERLRSRRSN